VSIVRLFAVLDIPAAGGAGATSSAKKQSKQGTLISLKQIEKKVHLLS
jgi:hypothetical protein